MVGTAIVTGAWGPARELAGRVAARLAADGWVVRATGPQALDDSLEDPPVPAYVAGDLRDEAFTASLFNGLPVGGRVVVVHLAPLVSVADVAYGHQPAPLVEALDVATRGTYVLYKAAIAAGGGEAVQASSLASMDAYPDDFEVTEQWRPRPAPTAQDLAPHLCESVAIEFTRDPMVERPMAITCLRFASLIDGAPGDEASVPDDARTMWAHDAADAVVRSIVAREADDRRSDRGHRWRLLHVASGAPGARYTSALAGRVIGYAPAAIAGGSR
jgi:nucleoside-diphosphate-sugar epimerase